MSKKILMVCSILLLLLSMSLGIAGCGSSVSAEEIAANAVSNCSELTTYKCQMSMDMDIEVTGGSESGKMTASATVEMAFDAVNEEMQMIMDGTMDVELPGFDANADFEEDVYLVDGWMYARMHMLGQDEWAKKKAPDFSDIPEDSLNQMVKLLETAIKVKNVGSEKVDGVDCDIIEATPDMQALFEWIQYQQEDTGMDLEDLDMEDIDWNNVLKSFEIKYWISQDACLPVKADCSVSMEIRPEDMGETSESADMDKVTMNIGMQCKFYDWNEHVIIELPPEALDAEEVSSAY